jgi:hypothetical protein
MTLLSRPNTWQYSDGIEPEVEYERYSINGAQFWNKLWIKDIPVPVRVPERGVTVTVA